MTRKDYIFIAKLIKDNTCSIEIGKVKDIHIVYKVDLVEELCDMFKDDNKLFNKDKFIKACE